MTIPPAFLTSLLYRYNKPTEQSKPHVTLTFAQSLDAKIAGRGGKQLTLSGKESMVMTHWMRTMHDGILIGIGTALNDDPQLNTRLLPYRDPDPSANGHNNPYNIPRPIILDTKLRLSPHCKLLKNYTEGKGRRPWLICTEPSETSEKTEWLARRDTLDNAGARIVVLQIGHDTEGDQICLEILNLSQISMSSSDYLPIPLVLQTIHQLGISSVMVEGGAQVIRSFLSQNAVRSATSLVNTVIITIAPIFVGEDGVSYNAESGPSSVYKHASTAMFGQDTIVGLIPAYPNQDAP
ncbi:dihydrofolate reductase-like domain-containing protein [Lentinula aciculospora]|uniref:2,5-diamino-6-ribosylamino-4(3H)-pyrimidinone 5'-phosphate reductase n=1 Tax=Lentinula aciculospora TaxID=153920 RepID=A0A9W9DQX1_9AGAR|nr:dihydrofolate reductase-like domain-containing protein [Lentinula aciculospora]